MSEVVHERAAKIIYFTTLQHCQQEEGHKATWKKWRETQKIRILFYTEGRSSLNERLFFEFTTLNPQ